MRTKVYHQPPLESYASLGTHEAIFEAIRAEGERFRRDFCQMGTFTYATGRTVRMLVYPWEGVDPREARVLITPPPWSVS
jgi:hypothetical protein